MKEESNLMLESTLTLHGKDNRQIIINVYKIAEGKGFEPLRDLSTPTHFPGEPFQPLMHPSVLRNVLYSKQTQINGRIV